MFLVTRRIGKQVYLLRSSAKSRSAAKAAAKSLPDYSFIRHSIAKCDPADVPRNDLLWLHFKPGKELRECGWIKWLASDKHFLMETFDDYESIMQLYVDANQILAYSIIKVRS